MCPCGESNPENFHKDTSRPTGYKPRCKTCVSAYMADYYRQNAEELKRKRRARYRRRQVSKNPSEKALKIFTARWAASQEKNNAK